MSHLDISSYRELKNAIDNNRRLPISQIQKFIGKPTISMRKNEYNQPRTFIYKSTKIQADEEASVINQNNPRKHKIIASSFAKSV